MNKVHQHIIHLAIALVLFAVGTGFFLSQRKSTGKLVFAADSPLEVSWTDKLFDYDNLLPGDPIETKDIVIKNTGSESFDVYFGAIDTDFTKGEGGGLLHEKLDVKLSDGSGTDYWSGTLAELFKIARDNGCTSKDDMTEDCAVDLGIRLNAGEETTLSMSVKFDKSVDNNYQNSSVVFDMLTGFLAVGKVEAATTGPPPAKLEEVTPLGSILGIATGANLLPSIMASLAALSTGLYLRRRSSSSFTNPNKP